MEAASLIFTYKSGNKREAHATHSSRYYTLLSRREKTASEKTGYRQSNISACNKNDRALHFSTKKLAPNALYTIVYAPVVSDLYLLDSFFFALLLSYSFFSYTVPREDCIVLTLQKVDVI